MNILICGIPGTGKTTIAKELSRKFNTKFIVINDKVYSKYNNLGEYKTINSDQEYIVSTSKLSASIPITLKKNKGKNIILEGHLWCELSKSILKKLDYIFVIKCSKSILRKRLEERKYSPIKIEDNIYCLNNHYIENIFRNKQISFNLIKVNSNIKSNITKINKFLKL